MAETKTADIGRDKRKVKISRPIAEGMRAAEGKYCKSTGVINGYVARHACQDSTTARQRGLLSITTTNVPTNSRSTRLEGIEMLDPLLKFIDSGRIVRFDKRAVMRWACELVATGSDVVISLAVRSCGDLLRELKVRDRGKIDSCCYVTLVTGIWEHLPQALLITYLLAQVELPQYRRGGARWPRPAWKDKYMPF